MPVALRRGLIRGWSTTPSGRAISAGRRRLQTYGLEVLLRLDQDELATFFDAFFDLPIDVWAPYLRIDASSRQVTRTMTAVLRQLPRALRRRLVVDPRGAWS